MEFPTEIPADPIQQALAELELVYAFIYSRVGHRPDAEDLTQQVALKALPRLRHGAPAQSIRGYLFATARSVLAVFWSAKFGSAHDELDEASASAVRAPAASRGLTDEAENRTERILASLPANYRRVLELRFLRGYSIKEVAAEIKATPGSVKVMQLRALRAAAKVPMDV
ncbi:MAG: sigma-70 family RNA polymerase sigma factor [Candidatus Dormibacteraeota bacterium]|nr:sigma-70 family RNA polymerase sigma factor [Candidatus Dormibacteraeota bacterium]